MSEPKSLYVKVKTKRWNIEKFLKAKPAEATVDQDWLAWWDSRDMYSKSTLDKIPVYSSASNKTMLESFIDDPQTGGYEEAEGDEWVFSILMFSENYFEILPMLALFKGLAPFMEAGDSCELMIYDYVWADRTVMAHLVIDGKEATLKHTKLLSEVDKGFVEEANAMMSKTLDDLNEKYGDED